MAITTRRTGLGGTAALGDSVYSGADITNWSVTATQATYDANAKSDSYEVKALGRKSAQVTIEKLVAAAAFPPLLGQVLECTLTTGGESPEVVFAGEVIITQVGYQSPDGMEAENLQGESTGAFVLGDSGGETPPGGEG